MIITNLMCTALLALGIGDTPAAGQFACENLPHLIQESHNNNVDPALMVALIHHESRWKITAFSRAGACGLTQILPRYTGNPRTGVPRLTCEQLYDPETSITMGARLVSFWVQTHGRGITSRGLCGYNAGYRCRGSSPHRAGMYYARTVMRTASRINRKIDELRATAD